MDLLFWPEKLIGGPFSSVFICFQAFLAMLWWLHVHGQAVSWMSVRHRQTKLSVHGLTCGIFAVRLPGASYTRICPGYMCRILFLVTTCCVIEGRPQVLVIVVQAGM